MILSFVAAAMIIGGFKLALLSCGIYFRRFGVQSPSGHTALSLAVLAAFAMLLSSQLSGWRRVLSMVLPSVLIGGIAATMPASRTLSPASVTAISRKREPTVIACCVQIKGYLVVKAERFDNRLRRRNPLCSAFPRPSMRPSKNPRRRPDAS
jgi:hypothetical protein